MSYGYLISPSVYLTPTLITHRPLSSARLQLSPTPAKGSTWSGSVTTAGGCLASWTKFTVTTLSSWWRARRPQRRRRRALTRPKSTSRASRTEPSSTACKPSERIISHMYLLNVSVCVCVCYLTFVNKEMSELVIRSCSVSHVFHFINNELCLIQWCRWHRPQLHHVLVAVVGTL